MTVLSITVWCDYQLTIKEVVDYILKTYPGYNIIRINEGLFPDVLEDGSILYTYYVMAEREE